MTRAWLPDRGWTGEWTLPDVLRRPVSERDRAVLVSLACNGSGPNKLVRTLTGKATIAQLSGEHSARLRASLRALERSGARAIVPSDEEYPDELAEIDAPPPLLFVRGIRLDGLRPMVAIVGARACTSGAARFAYKLGESFATAGFTVVSGLARGIDGAAHRGALECGTTVAVLGTGIDVCYPAEHRPMAQRIVESGALVSEFPPAVGPRAWHFPARNRIITGLSCALVVVEAGMSSGALITVGFALDQGRHVLACTTGPENPAGAGVRELLKEGAQLIVDAEQAVEIVCDLIGAQRFAFGEPKRGPNDRRVSRLSPDLREVYDAISEESTVDEIAGAAGIDHPTVAAALSELELEGLVIGQGGRWSRPEPSRNWSET